MLRFVEKVFSRDILGDFCSLDCKLTGSGDEAIFDIVLKRTTSAVEEVVLILRPQAYTTVTLYYINPCTVIASVTYTRYDKYMCDTSSQHWQVSPGVMILPSAPIMSVEWRPCGLLSGAPTTPYAVLILNQPINRNALNAVIQNASLLVCADGGADRLFQCDEAARDGYKTRLPDAIVGDLDSLGKHVSEHYQSKGVKVIKDPDQYSTDFTKCLIWIRDVWRNATRSGDDTLDVVVLGGLGGRVDQGFSQIHHLYMASNDPTMLKGRLYLLSEQSLSFILENGVNNISLKPGYFEENIGIIPMLGRTNITTKGLEWDVRDWPTEFGGQMSTSNHIRSENIEIAFDGHRPLCTIELAAPFSATNSS